MSVSDEVGAVVGGGGVMGGNGVGGWRDHVGLRKRSTMGSAPTVFD